MIEFTIVNAVAVVIGLLGLAFVYNGLRFAWLDEMFIGAVLLVFSWWIIT